MKTFLAKKRNIFLARLFLGQLPLLVSTYLFLSRQFLNFSLVFQFLLVVINLASILVTVYLTREMRIRKFEDDDLVSPRTNQLMFIGLTGFMSIICLYRGVTAGESYQQLIAYILVLASDTIAFNVFVLTFVSAVVFNSLNSMLALMAIFLGAGYVVGFWLLKWFVLERLDLKNDV